MNVPVIEMERDQAKEKLEAYRAQLHRRADSEYEAAVVGYTALANGMKLVNVADALRTGGMFTDGRPKLAIAGAAARQVEVTYTAWRRQLAFDWSSGRQRPSAHTLTFGFDTLDGMRRGFALVPMIPADVRPNVALKDCHILWEVEGWADTSRLARPDRDPYLLRHVIGDLYAVLAEWDLTELERAIMTARIPH